MKPFFFAWKKADGQGKLLNVSVAKGLFGLLLLILFSSLFIAGPKRPALDVRFTGALRDA